MNFEGVGCVDQQGGVDGDTCTTTGAYSADCANGTSDCDIGGIGNALLSGWSVGDGDASSMSLGFAPTEKVTADFTIRFPADTNNAVGPVIAGLKDSDGLEVFTVMWAPSLQKIQFRCGNTDGTVAVSGWQQGGTIPPDYRYLGDDMNLDIRMNFDGSGSNPVCTYYVDRTDLGGTEPEIGPGVGNVLRNDGIPTGVPVPLEHPNGEGVNAASFFHTESTPLEAFGSIIDDIGICNAAVSFPSPGSSCQSGPEPTATPSATPTTTPTASPTTDPNCRRGRC